MAAVMEKPDTTQKVAPSEPVKAGRRISRSMVVGAILVVWLLLFAVLRGKQTLSLAAADLTALHRWFNEVNDSIGANRNSNPLFLYSPSPPAPGPSRRSAGSASSASPDTSPGPSATGGSRC